MAYVPKHKSTPLRSHSLRITPLPLWAMTYTDTQAKHLFHFLECEFLTFILLHIPCIPLH